MKKKMEDLKRHLPVLEYLKSLSSKEQKELIKNAPKPLLNIFSSIALNLIKQNIPLSPHNIKRLKQHEGLILKLSQRKHSLKARKKLLQRSGLLSSLLSILPSLVSGVLASLT